MKRAPWSRLATLQLRDGKDAGFLGLDGPVQGIDELAKKAHVLIRHVCRHGHDVPIKRQASYQIKRHLARLGERSCVDCRARTRVP